MPEKRLQRTRDAYRDESKWVLWYDAERLSREQIDHFLRGGKVIGAPPDAWGWAERKR